MWVWDVIALLTSRTFVIALAITGAGIATLGNMMMREGSSARPARARMVLWTGYALTGFSVFCFILAGFLSNT